MTHYERGGEHAGSLLGVALHLGLGGLLALAACDSGSSRPGLPPSQGDSMHIALPTPRTDGPKSFESTLVERRSVRAFRPDTLEAAEVGQLLWAAQGITRAGEYRTAPSAGALYPLELYAVTPAGVSHYDPGTHSLSSALRQDVRANLCDAAHDQEWIRDAPLVIAVTAVYSRIAVKYGESRGPRYVHIEAGHASQNVLLQAAALGLGAVPVGAFDDRRVKSVLHLPADHEPLYLLCVGRTP